MFTLSTPGDQSPTASPATVSATGSALTPVSLTAPTPPTVPPVEPVTHTEPVRHMLFGSLGAVQAAIKDIHRHGYAEPNDWSLPMSTGRPNEVMAILTKRVNVE